MMFPDGRESSQPAGPKHSVTADEIVEQSRLERLQRTLLLA